MKLTFQAYRIFGAINIDCTTRYGEVFACNCLLDIAEGNFSCLHFKDVGFNLNLTFKGTDYINPGDLFHSFDLILCNICIFLEFVEAIISRDINVHHRKFREVDIKNLRLIG